MLILFVFHLFPVINGIYNGNETIPEYTVLIKEDSYHGYFACTGSIINARWVLSHGPCIDRFLGKILVYFGISSFGKDVSKPGVQKRGIIRVVQPPDYNPVNGTNSLVLIEVEKDVNLAYLKIIQLPTKDINEMTTTSCEVIGYGTKRVNDTFNDFGTLYGQSIRGGIKKGKDGCGCLTELQPIQKKDYLCVDYSVGICEGDFGAALVCNVDNDQTAIGVAHNFIPCPNYDFMQDYYAKKYTACGGAKGEGEKTVDIYTDLFPYVNWIDDVIKYKQNKYPSRTGFRLGSGYQISKSSTIVAFLFNPIFINIQITLYCIINV